MKIIVDAAENSVAVTVARRLYSDDAVRIAGHVFSGRAEVYHDRGRIDHVLTLVARRKGLGEDGLEALGGDCLNELLNHEYRALTGRFHRKIADRIVSQVLLSARGGENPAPPPVDPPELKAEAARLLAAAAEEIGRTMPKRVAPQGFPLAKPTRADGRR